MHRKAVTGSIQRLDYFLSAARIVVSLVLREDVLKQDFDYKQDRKLKFQKSLISDGLKRFLPFISLIALCALIPLGEYFLLEKDPVFHAGQPRRNRAPDRCDHDYGDGHDDGHGVGRDRSLGRLHPRDCERGRITGDDRRSARGGFLICVAVGAACGLINGAAVAALKIPAFIVTLGAMGIYRGLALYFCDGNAVVGLPSGFGYLAEKNFLGFVPLPMLIVIAIALIVHFALSDTRLGRYCYAMGSNPEAARYAGIRVSRYQILYFTILGALGAGRRDRDFAPGDRAAERRRGL